MNKTSKLLTVTLLFTFFSCGKIQPLKTAGQLVEGLVIKAPQELTKKALGLKDDNDSELEDRVSALEQEVSQINTVLDSLQSQIDDGESDQDTVEQLVALNQSRLAALETSSRIAEIIDPCGDDPANFDEVVLKTASGSFLAYFEQGGRRFLSELPDGNYRTTDRQRCRFSIDNGVLID